MYHIRTTSYGLILRLIWVEIIMEIKRDNGEIRLKNPTKRTEDAFSQATFSFLFVQKQTTTRGSPQPQQVTHHDDFSIQLNLQSKLSP